MYHVVTMSRVIWQWRRLDKRFWFVGAISVTSPSQRVVLYWRPLRFISSEILTDLVYLVYLVYLPRCVEPFTKHHKGISRGFFHNIKWIIYFFSRVEAEWAVKMADSYTHSCMSRAAWVRIPTELEMFHRRWFINVCPVLRMDVKTGVLCVGVCG